MRLVLCYRIARSKGFFLGKRLFFFKKKIFGYFTPAGLGLQPKQWLYSLSDGNMGLYTYNNFFKLGQLTGVLRSTTQLRLVNLALRNLGLHTPFSEPF